MPVPPDSGRGQPWTGTDIQAGRNPRESAGAAAPPDASGEARRRDEQEKQIGKGFESVLLTKVFEQVQASIDDSGFDDEDSGSQQVRGMFWLQLAQDVADKGGFGLWKDIYQHIKQMEGVAQAQKGASGGLDGIGDLAGSLDEEL
jgi:Rod binding domain-containing protein